LMMLSPAIGNLPLSVLVLSLAFAASDFMLPTCWAVCLDIGKSHAGTVTGTMNMAGQMGATVSSYLFGGLVEKWGWDRPLVGLGALFFLSAMFWLRIDASRPLITQPAGS